MKCMLGRILPLCALLSVGIVSAQIPPTHFITNSVTQNLTALSARLATNTESGKHVVQFNSYTNVGNFRIDAAPRIDTLIFERNPRLESDSVLDVAADMPLFEIKRMARTTVIFRGLAFRMTSPSSILLAGWEPGKENLNLILDSCFVFGDSIAASFLNWNATADGKVEFWRSFFSWRTGNATNAKFLLTAGRMDFHNNVFSFPGYLHANVLGNSFLARSNTVNRMQFRLDPTVVGIAPPKYEFLQTFVAHPPPGVDAFGQSAKYVLHAGAGFDVAASRVGSSRLFNTWTAFDSPSNLLQSHFDTLSAASNITNFWIRPTPGKAAEEKWNWYQNEHPTIGFGDGIHKRSYRFNVWPGETQAPIRYEMNVGEVFFKPAHFPRYIAAHDSVPRDPADTVRNLPADIRVHTPKRGAVRFGAFQVESISLPSFGAYGKPVLLAADTSPDFRLQTVGVAPEGNARNIFLNGMSSARRFFLGFSGNTPRGSLVQPDPINLGANGYLSYSKVDTAGETRLDEVPDRVMVLPDSLRALGNLMSITTTAAVEGAEATMRFAFEAQFSPYLPGRVAWLDTVTRALTVTARSGEGNYPATVPAVRSLRTILVERLNVKRGRTTVFPLGDSGSAQVSSSQGFQLLIDDSVPVDSMRYGPRPKAYAFTWHGRGPADNINVKLPAGPDHGLFMFSGNYILPIPAPTRDSGFFKFSIAHADSGKAVFSAIPFNVIGGKPFDSIVSGVRVPQLNSTTSGKLDFPELDRSKLQRKPGVTDSLPINARVLGGRDIKALFLGPVNNVYSVFLPVDKAGLPANVAAFAFNGTAWRKLKNPVYHPDSIMAQAQAQAQVFDLQIGDKAFVVMEVLADPGEYVIQNPPILIAGDRKIAISTRYRAEAVKPIKSFSLEVTTVDDTGGTSKVTTALRPIGDTAVVDLSRSSGLHSYSVHYYIDEQTAYSLNPPQVDIMDFAWLPEKLRIAEPERRKDQWYAVGFPGQATFNLGFDTVAIPDTTYALVRRVLRLATDPAGMARWDTLPKAEIRPSPGSGYLVAANFPQVQKVDGTFQTQAPKPFELKPFSTDVQPDSGWRLISVPFPIPFDVETVKSNKVLKPFLAFTANRDAIPRIYGWEPTSQLRPWQAYAYPFEPGEVLTFDPWNSRDTAAASAKVAAQEAAGVEVRLETGLESRSMRLLSGPQARNIPYLPAPGRGLEVRIGGKGGYFWKTISSPRGIDEPLQVTSPTMRNGRLRVKASQTSNKGAWTVRLIDLSTGKVYEDGSLDALQFQAGISEFRLLAGDPAFVEERVRGFQAGLPTVIALSQNFPNPFRHTTRIALDWPALAGSAEEAVGRRARLDIFDARGRRVQRIELGKVKPGRQELTLDASRWEAGVYTYRLTVQTGKGPHRLQKRMLVTR